jgi:hypothetical protein
VFRWLREESLQLSTSVKEALSEHLEADAPRLDRTSRATGDDPGYLDDTIPEETVDRLAASENPELNLVRIL